MESIKQISQISKYIAIIVMKEEFELIVKQDNYEIDSEFTQQHKNILISYKKTHTFKDEKGNTKTVEGIIITGVDDPLHKISPVGTETAHLLAYLSVSHYKPDVVISCGYAGSTGYMGLKKGDIVISKNKSSFYLRDCIIPVYKPFVLGLYPVFDCSEIGKQLGFYPGEIGTTESFVESDGGVALSKEISCVEMEFCAINMVCYNFGVGCIGLKIISDTDPIEKEKQKSMSADERKKEFEESLKNLNTTIHSGFLKLIEYISTH